MYDKTKPCYTHMKLSYTSNIPQTRLKTIPTAVHICTYLTGR